MSLPSKLSFFKKFKKNIASGGGGTMFGGKGLIAFLDSSQNSEHFTAIGR